MSDSRREASGPMLRLVMPHHGIAALGRRSWHCVTEADGNLRSVGLVEDEIRVDAEDALGAVGGLEVRRLFGGWGLYRRGLLFAAAWDAEFRFRTRQDGRYIYEVVDRELLGRLDELVSVARDPRETRGRTGCPDGQTIRRSASRAMAAHCDVAEDCMEISRPASASPGPVSARTDRARTRRAACANV